MGTITLAGSRGYQDIGTIGQTVPQLAENVLSINAILDVGLRNTRDYQHGWIRVSDLIGLGLATLINGDQLTATVSSGSGTVSVSDSITGTGASATPLLLQGDASAPGNSFYYGTNGSGTKGWYALPTSGGTVTSVGFADASTTSIYTITGSPVTTSGTLTQTLTTQTANKVFAGPASGGAAQPTFRALVAADIPASSPAVPGTIPDLVMWWAADNILAASGTEIYRLQDRTPWGGGSAYATGLSGGQPTTMSASTLNGLPTLIFGSTPPIGGFSSTATAANGGFTTKKGFTAFYVINPALNGSQALFGCSSAGGVSLYVTSGSNNKMTLVSTAIAVAGTETTAWSGLGAFFQGNATYNISTGAFAFRRAQAANGSGGTGVTSTGASTTNWLGSDTSATTSPLGSCGLAELIIYDRVLTGTEITNVENYLHVKWGV